MRLFSSRSEVGAQTGDHAWLRAMLDFEAALAGALADVGLAPASAAEEIAAVCGVGVAAPGDRGSDGEVGGWSNGEVRGSSDGEVRGSGDRAVGGSSDGADGGSSDGEVGGSSDGEVGGSGDLEGRGSGEMKSRGSGDDGVTRSEANDGPGSRPSGDDWDLDALGAGTARDGTPVPALLAQLRPRLSAEARAVLHRGATSQDVVDTAAMLVAKRALAPLLADLDAAGDAAAALADRHRGDIAAGRTLLQQALPITFGLRAAGWLGGLDDAAARLTAVREERLAVQFGGAVGTLASLGGAPSGPASSAGANRESASLAPLGDAAGALAPPGDVAVPPTSPGGVAEPSISPGGDAEPPASPDAAGLAVAEALARRLELPAPPVPWQSNRSRPVELAAALGMVAGAAGKVGTDVVLLAQTEVAEGAEGGGGGGSSALPQKRNPVAAVTAVAVARRTPGLVATMLAAMPGEEERAAGGWQAEAETLDELLRLTGIAVAAVRALLESLEVFPERMRSNLDATGGLVMAEGLTTALTGELGRERAGELVGAASRRALEDGRPLAATAAEVPEIAAALDHEEIVAALDPAGYLGATDELIDRALAAHRARVGP